MHALTPATATIDSGRLLTLERRREFSGLSLQLIDESSISKDDRILDCLRGEGSGVLSERAIARALLAFPGWYSLPGEPVNRVVGAFTGRLATWVHVQMRDWANGGYPKSDEGLVAERYFEGYLVRVKLHHRL